MQTGRASKSGAGRKVKTKWGEGKGGSRGGTAMKEQSRGPHGTAWGLIRLHGTTLGRMEPHGRGQVLKGVARGMMQVSRRRGSNGNGRAGMPQVSMGGAREGNGREGMLLPYHSAASSWPLGHVLEGHPAHLCMAVSAR